MMVRYDKRSGNLAVTDLGRLVNRIRMLGDIENGSTVLTGSQIIASTRTFNIT